MSANPKNIFVAGATSLIAQETMREYAENGPCHFFLVARDQDKLRAFAEDLKARGALDVIIETGDLIDSEFHKTMVQKLANTWPKTDIALLAWGNLGDEQAAQLDFQEAKRILVVNFTSFISLLIELAAVFAAQRAGTIAVLTSVAGDRGRRSNYTYGTAKAAVSTYLSGLRCRLAECDVKVIDIKPGIVSTPMTAHMRKSRLFADASTVGRTIYRVIERKQPLAYVPWFWRWIMMVVRSLPVFIFNRTKF